MPWWLGPALAVVGGMLSSRAQRGANDTDLVKLRNEANRSGFHPLTVLRATGGAGFTRGVHGGLSRMGALFSGASRMVGAYNANQRQIVDDAYNAEFRKQQILGMKQNLEIGKAQLSSMASPVDEYKGWRDKGYIFARYGKNEFKLDLDIAERQRIKPGQLLSVGDVEEIFGEMPALFTGFTDQHHEAMMHGDYKNWTGMLAGTKSMTTKEANAIVKKVQSVISITQMPDKRMQPILQGYGNMFQ